MPHPMSTPTADGLTAPRMAMTDPTVAPLPKWTSGMTARRCVQGRAATLRSWSWAADSISLGSAHIVTRAASAPGRVVGKVLTRVQCAGALHGRHPDIRQARR